MHLARQDNRPSSPALWGALGVLTAVVAGTFLGLSTTAEIDPFYRDDVAAGRGGSYTVEGWKGADAIPAPPAATYLGTVPADAGPSTIIMTVVPPEPRGDTFPDPADAAAIDDASVAVRSGESAGGWGDYECINCEEPEAVGPVQDDF